jgi:hypothetical protein
MALSRSIRRPLRRFAQVDGRRRRLVVEALVCLLSARLAPVPIPFPRLAGWLGTFVPPSDPRATRSHASSSPEQTTLAHEIGWAVTRSARYTPFVAVCLPQAMAGCLSLSGAEAL